MTRLAQLGFGHADVVVAVPEPWFDVETMADLGLVAADFRHRHGRRLRIATKYWRLTQQHFSQTHGIQLYRIIESLGATEGAPAAGQADVIVDITSTGSTLRANHLKVLKDGVILQSQACLFAPKPAPGGADRGDVTGAEDPVNPLRLRTWSLKRKPRCERVSSAVIRDGRSGRPPRYRGANRGRLLLGLSLTRQEAERITARRICSRPAPRRCRPTICRTPSRCR